MPEFQIPPTSDGADWIRKLCFLVASLMRFSSFFCHFLPSKLTWVNASIRSECRLMTSTSLVVDTQRVLKGSRDEKEEEKESKEEEDDGDGFFHGGGPKKWQKTSPVKWQRLRFPNLWFCWVFKFFPLQDLRSSFKFFNSRNSDLHIKSSYWRIGDQDLMFSIKYLRCSSQFSLLKDLILKSQILLLKNLRSSSIFHPPRIWDQDRIRI